MGTDEPVHDLAKNIDTEDLLSSFIVDMPRDYTDPEVTLKKELASLRKMRRTLTELTQLRKEEKSKDVIVKTGDKAKEEAMELLRSGAIQITDKRDRHTFKRKLKENEDEEELRTPVLPTSKEKNCLYANFLRGPKLVPLCDDPKAKRSDEPDRLLPKTSSHSNPEDVTSVNNVDVRKNHSGIIADCNGAVSTAEAAASKRKQQLIALSEEEDDGEELGVNDSDKPLLIRSAECSNSPIAGRSTGQNFGSPYGRSSETTLHVGYHQVTTKFICEMFQPVGEILRISISDNQNHAYVTMATPEMAQKALELDHQMVYNRLLRVGLARKPRCNRPFRPFSPKSYHGRGRFSNAPYNTAPPTESSTGNTETSRNLITYDDLNIVSK